MNYDVYTVNDSLYGVVSNNNKILTLSTDYHSVHIVYQNELGKSRFFYVNDDTIISKHIQKYLRKLSKYV